MISQKLTNMDVPASPLTEQQLTAAAMLVAGKTVTDAAQTLGVSRQIVSQWVNHNPAFQVEVNARRQELWAAMTDRLRGLVPKAIDILERELEGEHALAAATHILKAISLYGNVPIPVGPVEVEDAEIVQRQRSQARTLRALASLNGA